MDEPRAAGRYFASEAPEPGVAFIGERALWAAVATDAVELVRGVTNNGQGGVDEDERGAALRWIRRVNRDVTGFDWCCDLAGLDPQAVREQLAKAAAIFPLIEPGRVIPLFPTFATPERNELMVQTRAIVEAEVAKLGHREFTIAEISKAIPQHEQETLAYHLRTMASRGQLIMVRPSHGKQPAVYARSPNGNGATAPALPPTTMKPEPGRKPRDEGAESPAKSRAAKPPPRSEPSEHCPYCNLPFATSQTIDLEPPTCTVRWPELDQDVDATPVEDAREVFVCVPCRRFFTKVAFVVEVLAGQAVPQRDETKSPRGDVKEN
ncbi:MAG: hypothetical protein QOG85_1491 [Gaiellaceae bacterium]|nr:hypothetical protein [Gaiellaceae bacterium]